MISRLIDDALEARALDPDSLRPVLRAALHGELSDVQLAGLLVTLRFLPPTGELLAGAVLETLRLQHGVVGRRDAAVDGCGTGGDGAGTFNVSTAAALVAAACGAQVVKHGNRGVSSKSGSADALEALGVPIEFGASKAERALAKHDFVFLFAPRFHPSLAHVGPVRRELGVRTLFNLMGPLLNPAGVERQVIGVASDADAEVVGEACRILGRRLP